MSRPAARKAAPKGEYIETVSSYTVTADHYAPENPNELCLKIMIAWAIKCVTKPSIDSL